jgi:hypothetical protein
MNSDRIQRAVYDSGAGDVMDPESGKRPIRLWEAARVATRGY